MVEFQKGKLSLPVMVKSHEVFEVYGNYVFIRFDGEKAKDILKRLGEGRVKVRNGKILQREKDLIIISVYAKNPPKFDRTENQ